MADNVERKRDPDLPAAEDLEPGSDPGSELTPAPLPELPDTAAIEEILEGLRKGCARGRAKRDVEGVMMLAQGLPHRVIAQELGLSPRTVGKMLIRNKKPLEELQRELRMIALAAGMERFGEVNEALLDTASNTEARHQAQAARAYGEFTGLIGKPSVHIGDVNTTNVSYDLGSKHVHIGHDPELEAKLRADLVG